MVEKQSAEFEERCLEKSDRNAACHVKVNFLGHEYSPDEYRIACKNLADFFFILKEWAEKEKNAKEETES